jgi:rSAM/selenodomain-associated transferase 1
MTGPALLVIAKEPRPGHAKTRLCPPCTPHEAAELAAAALKDTLEVVAATPATRRVLVFEGNPRNWLPSGFELIPQRGAGLAERLAAAFEDVDGPALLVGMDTPQLTSDLLVQGLAALTEADAVLGPATDGGYWSIGLKRPSRAVFENIPMSDATTCAAQHARIRQLGMRLHEQPPLRDVDTFGDALLVARQAPRSRFAATLATLATPVAA